MANGFNPLASFNQGVQARQNLQAAQRQNQISQLQGALAGQAQQGGFRPSQSLDFQQLSVLDPTTAERTRSTFESLSESRKKAYHEDLRDGLNALEQGDGESFMNIMNDRLQAIDNLKGDPTGTQFLINKFDNGEIPELIQGLKRTEQAGIVGGFLPDPEKGRRRTAGEREFKALTKGLTSAEEKQARMIKLGLSPRAVGSAIQTITDQGIEELVGDASAVIKQREKFGEMTGSSRAKTIDKGLETITKIDLGISNIDRALTALNSGAGVGAIERFLPSFKAASVALDNVQKRMALDVVGAVTFGALSKGELDLAKEVALPTGLDTPQLIQHLQDRKVAQEKLKSYYNDQIQFLDQGGTVAGFLRQKEREVDQGGAPQPGQPQPGAQPVVPSQTAPQVIRFDAQGNQIQ